MADRAAGRPGRPRSEPSRVAVLAATSALLDEVGLRAMTTDEIAARSGVSNATIYKWWSNKYAVAVDAFLSEMATEVSGRIGQLPKRATRERVSARKLISAAVAVVVCVAAAEPARADPNAFAVLGCSCHETASAGSPDLRNEIDQGIRQGLATSHRP
ncbi:TetR/AcrR family transcriptional regulator [Mycobacterium servetii]|uniref:TetR/AcrR family transcriptional regulator n=1 Tax=Mycobacterium servetii TaxID=3237418 RepID=A0ABV4C2A7_9MYCO